MEPPPISNSSARRPPPAQQRRAGFQRQFGFLAGGDHADVQAGLVLHPGEELPPVDGAAAGLGGDRAHPRAPAGGPAARHRHAARPAPGPWRSGSARRCGAAPRRAGRCGRSCRARGTRRRPARRPACGSCWCPGRARRRPARRTGASALSGRRGVRRRGLLRHHSCIVVRARAPGQGPIAAAAAILPRIHVREGSGT